MKFYKGKNSKDPITHVHLESFDEVNIFLDNKDIFWKNSINSFQEMNKHPEKGRSRAISHTIATNAVTRLASTLSWLYDYKMPVSANVCNDFYNNQMLDFFWKKENIFVNKVGGYMYVEAFDLEKDFELVQDVDIKDLFAVDNYSFEYDSSENKKLVFENDAELDPWTRNHFDGRVPYICSLRETLSSNKFEEICERFTKYYSKDAFIYTTGLDYPQILEYVERASKCGFETFEFVFNQPYFDDIKLKEDLRHLDVELKISKL